MQNIFYNLNICFSLTLNRCASSKFAVAWYDKTSNVTFCFAIATIAFSYMYVLWMPIPQKMAKASTKFSSFFVNGRSLNLLINCITPIILPDEFLIGMQSSVLCLKSAPSSTLGSNRGSSCTFAKLTVWKSTIFILIGNKEDLGSLLHQWWRRSWWFRCLSGTCFQTD